MSYQVIARKYRPQSFQDLIGQDHISQTLTNALKADRFPHALLFSGTRGVGKTSSARVLAKTLICPNATDFKPCNECTACHDITNGSHMDVIEIDGASNNGVDSIRDLRETVGYMPASGKFKVYIIDEVHMLSTSAFNALLKTLEEPPSHVIFIMATTEPQKIPVTILSRCQRFDFRRISTRLIQGHLENICKNENVKYDQESLWTLARLADGSMRDSLSLLDQVINFTNADVTLAKVIDVLGITDRALLSNTVQSLIHRDLESIVATVERLFSSGHDPVVFVQNLLEEIRHLLFVKVAQKPTELLDLSDGEIESLRAVSVDVSQEDIHVLFDMCLKGTQDIIRANNPRIVLEMLLLRMAQAPRIEDIEFFVSGKSNPTTRTTPRPQPQAQRPVMPIEAKTQRPTQSVAEAFDKAESLTKNWVKFVEQSKKINPSLAALLDHSSLISLDGTTATLGVSEKEEFFFDQLSDPKQANKLKELFLTVWKMNVRVVVKHNDDKATPSPQSLKAQNEETQAKQTREQVENHPMIQNLQKSFKGKIQKITELK